MKVEDEGEVENLVMYISMFYCSFPLGIFAVQCTLKGQCHEIFDPRFFSSIDPP
jgi:hypothetical protein